ncbi:fungal-specific transcription factor domain-containing protein [Flammula alnicola]|nr:fungal-specific transcription factor domain-containing protein [Flammula alnicola]
MKIHASGASRVDTSASSKDVDRELRQSECHLVFEPCFFRLHSVLLHIHLLGLSERFCSRGLILDSMTISDGSVRDRGSILYIPASRSCFFARSLVPAFSALVFAMSATSATLASPSMTSTLSVSPASSRYPSPAPSSDFSPNISKREYLLAQIRQKDAIIESLLKQLHNPYIATPLSIASYRMATSPSDHNNRNVLAWLDRLQSSVRDAGKKGGPQAFLDLRNLDAVEEDSEQESESKRTQGRHYEAASAKAGEADGEEASQEDDKLQSALPESHVPLGLIADLSLSNSKANRKKDRTKEARLTEEDLNDDNVGVANETYFMPGPATDLGIRATLIEQHSAPEILVHGLVKPEDVEKLFQIFYDRVNPFISLLDPVLHTPASTFARCPFLFTVICAISSRYYAEKSEIYPIAMHFAKHSAANALIDGWKSVELCQAYILMSIYAVPARRWEEDRSWLYTGLAIRIATDLNLHQVSTAKPQSENQEREILNKTRVWMICFNLDRSTATQFGKPSTIKEDYIVRNAKDWYKKSQYNLNHDVHLCGYSALLQIVAKFHDEIFSDPSSPTGLNKKVDFRNVTLTHDAHLTRYHEEWSKRFKDDSDPNDPSCAFRCCLLPFLVGYSRLVMFSFGFQQAYQRGFKDGDSLFFNTCLDAAKSVIENMIDSLAPTGYMRYAPDGHFVFASFASAFLLKLLRPEFSSFLVKVQENEIFDLIGRLIQTLSSPKIAIDDRHTPKLYARFLAGLLSRHRRDGATLGRLQTNPPPQNQIIGSSTQTNASTLSSAGMSRPASSVQSSDQTFGPGTGIMNQVLETPIYMPEATFAAGTGQISFGTDYEMTYGGGFSDEEMLATMQALKNPAWWQTMMMPGFSWPEGSPSPPASGVSSSPYPTNLHPATIPPSFGIFHGTQVMM